MKLTNKAFRTISSGVNMLADQSQKDIWTAWSFSSDCSPMPLLVVLAALDKKIQEAVRDQFNVPDEEFFYFDDRLLYLIMLKQTLEL